MSTDEIRLHESSAVHAYDGEQSMSTVAHVQGTVAEGFEGVREEFAAALAEDGHNEPGSQLAVYHHGRPVVDLWAGDGFSGDTLTAVFSSTKGAAHLVVALLVQDGVLDLSRTVASYWPEFAAEGKDRLTVAELLEHRSGVIWAHDGLTPAELADDRVLAEHLAGQRPYWEPGSGYGYHALVIGALTGEVVRRATGRSIQEHFEARIRAPYGLDLYLGLPEDLDWRFERVRPMNATPEQAAQLAVGAPGPDSLLATAFGINAGIDLVEEYGNAEAVRRLGPASAGGIGNARSLAKLYAAAIGSIDGRPPLLEPETAVEFGSHRTPGADLVVGEENHFGLGFEKPDVLYPGLGPDSFGHCGASGSQAFADPATDLAYGYARRRWAFPGGAAPENARLVAAVLHACGLATRDRATDADTDAAG